MISREELEAYDSAFQTLTDKAKATLKRDLASYISANEGATVEELREFAIQSLQSHIGVSNQQAATLAADWYDKLMKQDGLKLAPAELADAVPDEVITKAAHYQAGKLVEGDTEGFTEACTDLLEHSMKHSLNGTITKNVERDSTRGVRYARVPMGGETCAFCLMLASRGFVYKSADTAGEGAHYHKSCRCKAVPGVQGKTKVAGYDPDSYYRAYKRLQEADALDLPPKARNQVKRLLLNDTSLTVQEAENLWRQDSVITTVNMAKIESKEYKQHVRDIFGDDLYDTVYKDIYHTLKANSGTRREYLFAYDKTTGEKIVHNESSRTPSSVCFSAAERQAVTKAAKQGHEIILLHNHPGSTFPSVMDVFSQDVTGSCFGVVVCHDGSLYTYKATSDRIKRELMHATADEKKKIDDAYYTTYNKKYFRSGEVSQSLETLGNVWGVRFEYFGIGLCIRG